MLPTKLVRRWGGWGMVGTVQSYVRRFRRTTAARFGDHLTEGPSPVESLGGGVKGMREYMVTLPRHAAAHATSSLGPTPWVTQKARAPPP